MLVGALIAPGCSCSQDPPKDPAPTAPDPGLMLLLNAHEAPALQGFVALGERTPAALRRIAEDPDGALVVRGRAVTALQAFPLDPLSRPWLRVLTAAPEAPDLLRRKAEDVLRRWGSDPTTLTPPSEN